MDELIELVQRINHKNRANKRQMHKTMERVVTVLKKLFALHNVITR